MIGARPRTLHWLCVASFANQALVFPFYLMGIVAALVMRDMPEEEIRQLMQSSWATLVQPAQQDELLAYTGLLKAHGVALMSALVLRTLARFIGTLRMWQGWRDGFHIYTTAQLVGVLAPILIAGPLMFSFYRPGAGAQLVLSLLHPPQGAARATGTARAVDQLR